MKKLLLCLLLSSPMMVVAEVSESTEVSVTSAGLAAAYLGTRIYSDHVTRQAHQMQTIFTNSSILGKRISEADIEKMSSKFRNGGMVYIYAKSTDATTYKELLAENARLSRESALKLEKELPGIAARKDAVLLNQHQEKIKGLRKLALENEAQIKNILSRKVKSFSLEKLIPASDFKSFMSSHLKSGSNFFYIGHVSSALAAKSLVQRGHLSSITSFSLFSSALFNLVNGAFTGSFTEKSFKRMNASDRNDLGKRDHPKVEVKVGLKDNKKDGQHAGGYPQ